ncbi:MAG: fumarate hydratase, class [Gaiellales bacterium]|nr:fumarate hydratase, class [Gaiellales bacterium]
MSDIRTEHDMLGPVSVPAAALYGAQTARAAVNFGTTSSRLSDRPELLRALGQVKASAAEANRELGVLEPAIAAVIVRAAEELAAGGLREHFPIALVQGGGGTSTNMAVNEVLANRAAQLLGAEPGRSDVVHPLDHVNRSQSSNDVVPTALSLAVHACAPAALAGLGAVTAALDGLAARAGDGLRLGRTCLQDAVPLPIAAYHGAQATAVRRASAALRRSIEPLLEVPLGATAVGTGLGAPPGYRGRAVTLLALRSGLALRPAVDPFDALAHLDPLLRVASEAAVASLTLAKIAADIRLLSSGPVGGIGEVRIPAVQVGSSQMPGKVNPVIPELVLQASFEIRGSAHVVELAAAAGELDLNVMEMVVARHLLAALVQLGEVSSLFALRCLEGLEWEREVVDRHLEGSRAAAVERALESGHDAQRGDSRVDRAGTTSDTIATSAEEAHDGG